MDVIVRGIRSGLPLGDCLRIIASEAQEPVRSEFRYLIEQQTLGITVAEAVSKLYERVPVAESNFFAIVIGIQAKAGGNLSETLGNLSRVLARPQEDEGQDHRDEHGGEGLRRHHRGPSVRGRAS